MSTELLNIDFVPTTPCGLLPFVIKVNFTFRCVPSKIFIGVLNNRCANVPINSSKTLQIRLKMSKFRYFFR